MAKRKIEVKSADAPQEVPEIINNDAAREANFASARESSIVNAEQDEATRDIGIVDEPEVEAVAEVETAELPLDTEKVETEGEEK
jgi:hypothetical protein